MPHANDVFYVGYVNPMPRGHARTAARTATSVGAFILVAAAILAGLQHALPPTAWADQSVTLHGTLAAAPYPTLLLEEHGRVDTVLLVNPGKCGAISDGVSCGPIDPTSSDRSARDMAELVQSLNGRAIEATGTLLSRNGRRMLELERGRASVRASTIAATVAVGTTPMGASVLTGQIVDPKCFLGAMRPGEGKVHRACATLCIRGGIPPALAVVEPDGTESLYLLAGRGGTAANAKITALAGDVVRVHGDLAIFGDIGVLRVDSTTIQPAR